jgi:hypothetical protein
MEMIESSPFVELQPQTAMLRYEYISCIDDYLPRTSVTLLASL